MATVDIFVGNHTVVDPDIYQLWINGYSGFEAAKLQQARGVQQKFGCVFDDIVSDTLDYYRLFTSLERLLKTPPKLVDQQVYQLDTATLRLLIQQYYSIDPSVVREILGKKLSARNRKDLDDVNEKTKVPLRSCRRQFDNIKRVFKTVEDMLGSLVQNIKKHYLVSEQLAKQYAAIVFITNNKFETGKKKLSYLTFDDFFHCADKMIANWSYSSEDCENHEDMDVDLDRNFLQELRDLKMLLEKEYLDEHKSIALQNVKSCVSEKIYQDMDSNFRTFSKTIVNIAYGLNHSKEAKDIFVDIVEKLIEPFQQLRWHQADVSAFLTAYKEACHQMEFFMQVDPRLLSVWERYMNTLSSCILQMYHT
ncbi:acidic fibroblast growth factor intracellular-binding protein-like [Liolophura sinensis]|uniref:acidic fibroblast growth factor intracellular-binding protein-like n=1 Tax=Liolophura sinensis TaxID=3198878 RepID=UPI0031589222